MTKCVVITTFVVKVFNTNTCLLISSIACAAAASIPLVNSCD